MLKIADAHITLTMYVPGTVMSSILSSTDEKTEAPRSYS